MADTEKVKQETNEQKLKKGARNGLYETSDRGEVRREADVRRWLPGENAPPSELQLA